MFPGEGVYKCHNGGSCLAPDTCSCPDGWGGYDCDTPLCRHLQPSGKVSGCQNGGICSGKDDCACVVADSVLWQVSVCFLLPTCEQIVLRDRGGLVCAATTIIVVSRVDPLMRWLGS